MKRFYLLLLMIFLTLTAASCIKKRPVEPGFYYWKSSFRLSQEERKALQMLKVKRMYVKFFDVVWKGAAVPEAEVRFRSKPPGDMNIVPTVFVTNTSLKNLPQHQVDGLAAKICAKTLRMARDNHLNSITEIQLDCDWTPTTREKYFRLLQGIRGRLQNENIGLSATIRLHQIKYRHQTGVPPVDRGMLMTYNVEPVQEMKTENSIFNPSVVKDYLQHVDQYPLPLDAALPIFAWGVVFQGERFIGLINNLGKEDIRDQRFYKSHGQGLVEVLRDTQVRGVRLYHGDRVRLETAEPKEVRSVIRYLRRKLGPDNIRVAIYHFDDLAMGRIGYAKIQKYFTDFAF